MGIQILPARHRGVIVLALAVALGLGVTARADTTGADGLARDILRELVDTNTTHSQGSTVAARALSKRFLAAGFPAADVQLLTPAEHPTKGNLVVRLHGQGKGAPVLYICHLDVVEAKREDWNYDPFRLTEKDGWLYGRGTIDMKGQDAAVATSLIRLRQEGFVPSRDLIVAFTADEESGGDANGVGWLFSHHRKLVDAGIVINPDGGEAGVKDGRKLYVAVQTSEKVFLTFGLEVTDKGGHSSVPTAANPIYRLSAALARLSQIAFPVHLTDTTRMYFERRAGVETGPLKSPMLAISRDPKDAAAAARLSEDMEVNTTMRTTCTTTMIDGGHAENALPQRARATVQCRVVPGESPESVEAAIRQSLADPSIRISTITPATPSPESPPAPALLAMVEGIVGEMWPGVVVLPQMSPGASDSRYTRTLGIPSYGIDAMFDDLADGRAHGRDERISVTAFREDVEFTYRLMRRLAIDAGR